MAKTVQELIDLLKKIEDKSQTIYVWDRFGYYGTDLTVEVETDQQGKPLIIKSN
jgi:hypothetical protein